MFFFYLLVFLLVIVLAFLGVSWSESEARQKKEDELMKFGDNALNRSNMATTTATIKRHYEEFKSEYDRYSDPLSSSSKSFCDYTLNELRSNYITVLENDVDEKTEKYLDGFIDDFVLLTELMDFFDVDDAYKRKNSCLRNYDAYWETVSKISDNAVSDERSLVWEKAKKNFIDAFTENSQSNIHFWDENGMNKSVRQQLVAEIDKCVETLKPEYKRKMKIYDDILSVVRSKESIKRADLLRTKIDNATEEEVSVCYKVLVKKGKLFEMKLGNRYFVSLSDKESQKKQ